MMFMGAFMLLVLPLFLLICAQMIRDNKSFNKSIFGKLLEILFYGFALLAILTAIYLVTLI